MPTSNSFDGQVAVITGAARGIGAATAEVLGSRGAIVVLIDIDEDGLNRTAALLSDAGINHLSMVCDHADEKQVNDAAQKVLARYGRCDILVNNAASKIHFKRLEDETFDAWQHTIAVNLHGYFLCTKAFGKLMLDAGRGVIVNLASPGASSPIPAGGAYSIAYAGRVMLARQAALEWGQRGIRVNVVSPGQTLTAGISEWAGDEALKKRKAVVPLGRLADPQEQARVIAFVCSDEASFISGQEICVDGGQSQMLLSMIPHPGEVQIFEHQR